jgi:hypothetical protein
MKNRKGTASRDARWRAILRIAAPAALHLAATHAIIAVPGALASDQGMASRPAAGITPCERAAIDLRKACVDEAWSDYYVALAYAKNLADEEERREAADEAREELREALAECSEQYEARLDLCEELDEFRYDPEIDPGDFTNEVTNPYFPLTPGVTQIYEKETDEGLERLIMTTLHETREIMGVECAIVQATEFLDGELVEDTLDYFAMQISTGSVWYFGENSLELEDGVIVSVSGSFIAGEEGAKPGIIMLGDPQVGQAHRQEFALAEAEDAGRVVAVGQTVSIGIGDFDDGLKTEDFSPLEPGNVECKFYAPGVGLIAEFDIESGELLELVETIVMP